MLLLFKGLEPRLAVLGKNDSRHKVDFSFGYNLKQFDMNNSNDKMGSAEPGYSRETLCPARLFSLFCIFFKNE